MTGTETKKHTSQKWSTKKRIGLIGIILMVIVSAILIVGGFFLYKLFNQATYYDPDANIGGNNSQKPKDPAPVVDTPIHINDNATTLEEIALQANTKNITNILLIGADPDTPDTIEGHSDTNIILSINKNDKSIRMASLMRDSLVWRDGEQKKLNSAYYDGGFSELQQVLIDNYRIQIDKAIVVNFWKFREIIDTLGGVDIKLDEDELDYIYSKIYSYPSQNNDGTYHLTGEEALWFSRNRTTFTTEGLGNDFARTSRQRVVLNAVFEKAKKMTHGDILSASNDIVSMIHTNLSQSEIEGYILNALDYLKYDIKQSNYPNDGEYDDVDIDGRSLLIIDPVELVLRLHHFIYD